MHFPIDGEFSRLYILYLILFSFLFYRIFLKNSKSNKIRSIIILASCILLNALLYWDPESFKYGGSLVVLFYSGILLVFATIVTIVNEAIEYRIRKRRKQQTVK
jgi:hypothetical protein